METKSEGVCTVCNNVFSGQAMSKHLLSCIKRKNLEDTAKGAESIFLLKAYAGPFWVFFQVNALRTLDTLDGFLRRLWLECCGHLSAFMINGTYYNSSGSDSFSDSEEQTMNVPLKKVINVGTTFSYEYDFGTTTELGLKCIAEYKGTENKIKMIARNNIPTFICINCKEVAKHICAECDYDGSGLLCKTCSKEHECGEEMLLPVVNSPRMGMCGYTGN